MRFRLRSAADDPSAAATAATEHVGQTAAAATVQQDAGDQADHRPDVDDQHDVQHDVTHGRPAYRSRASIRPPASDVDTATSAAIVSPGRMHLDRSQASHAHPASRLQQTRTSASNSPALSGAVDQQVPASTTTRASPPWRSADLGADHRRARPRQLVALAATTRRCDRSIIRRSTPSARRTATATGKSNSAPRRRAPAHHEDDRSATSAKPTVNTPYVPPSRDHAGAEVPSDDATPGRMERDCAPHVGAATVNRRRCRPCGPSNARDRAASHPGRARSGRQPDGRSTDRAARAPPPRNDPARSGNGCGTGIPTAGWPGSARRPGG